VKAPGAARLGLVKNVRVMVPMANSILVIDDDTLMRPLAVHPKRVGSRRNTAVSAAEALPVIQGYPPEVIFLTARQAKLDQMWRRELGGDDYVVKSFDLDMRLARIRAARAALVASVAARWRQLWVPAIFALGVLLLVLAAPRWIGWWQGLATFELPSEQVIEGWLTNLLFDPMATFGALFSTTQTWLTFSDQIDALTMLGTIVLAVASVAGLAQLLGGEHKTTSPGA
jgi:hypothetical protein